MRFAVLLLALLPMFASPALAADDVAAAQNIIRSQEQAFGNNDAASAYSYASPALKEIFSDAETFMSMVQNLYAPVYRHKSFDFGASRSEDGQIAQRVDIVDANGEAWEALYTLERQPDGSLKITGCSLRKVGQAA